MLASQLCVFDEQSGSKSKWVKAHSMVVFSESSSLFVKILVSDALLSRDLFNDIIHAKWICHTLTQGIRRIKTFIKYKKYYCWYIFHKKHKEAASNVEATVTK